MKTVIRNGVFETNSSSVHALTWKADSLAPSELEIDQDGMLPVHIGCFGSEKAKYFDQNTKLSYLFTYLIYNSHFWSSEFDKNSDIIKDDYDMDMVRKVICDYTGAKDIRLINAYTAQIDNQGELDDIVNIYDDNSILNFIFNPQVGLETYHD